MFRICGIGKAVKVRKGLAGFDMGISTPFELLLGLEHQHEGTVLATGDEMEIEQSMVSVTKTVVMGGFVL